MIWQRGGPRALGEARGVPAPVPVEGVGHAAPERGGLGQGLGVQVLVPGVGRDVRVLPQLRRRGVHGRRAVGHRAGGAHGRTGGGQAGRQGRGRGGVAARAGRGGAGAEAGAGRGGRPASVATPCSDCAGSPWTARDRPGSPWIARAGPGSPVGRPHVPEAAMAGSTGAADLSFLPLSLSQAARTGPSQLTPMPVWDQPRREAGVLEANQPGCPHQLWAAGSGVLSFFFLF